MLTASLPMPKHSSSDHAPEYTPRPQNWQGVESGLEEASRLLRQDELSHAEEVMRQVLEFAPMEGQAWHFLGRILQKANRHAEALDCFASAESCYGRDNRDQRPPASMRLARLLWGQGEYDGARAMLGILAMRSPDDDGLRQLCATWSQQGGQDA